MSKIEKYYGFVNVPAWTYVHERKVFPNLIVETTETMDTKNNNMYWST